MPTQPQHALNTPLPLNDLGVPHEYTEVLNVRGNFENTSQGPMVPGAFGEMNGNEWTGRLYSNWNDTYAYARALAAEAIGDPYAHTMRFDVYQSEDSHQHTGSYQRGQSTCDLNSSLILRYPHSISRHGSIRPRPRWCGLETQMGRTSATLTTWSRRLEMPVV